MKGLAKRLKAGSLTVHHQRGVEIIDDTGLVIDQIAGGLMTFSEWGIVYERWVGLALERDGWEVDYRGLSLGLCDQGIDLVACQGAKTRFIQCKFLTRAFGKQQIEQILYKGSTFLSKQNLAPQDVFELIVPSIETAFPTRIKKNKPQQNLLKARFLSHNRTQNRIRLDITEITMDLGISEPLP